jgi:peptidyl-prolyl cis-trans isomerase SurA
MPVRLFLLILIAFGTVAAQQRDSEGRLVLDEIAAVVGSEIILSSEIKMLTIQTAQQEGIDASDTTAMKALSQQMMEREIGKNILLHHAREAKIEVGDDELSQMVENYLNQLRRGYKSEADFQRDMEAVGQTLVGLKEMYREISREELLSQNFLRENSHELPQVKVTEEEARELFEAQPLGNSPEQVKFQYMIVPPKPGEAEVERAKAKIDSLYKIFLEGKTDFAWLAERNSDGPSASNGGDLGFFSRGEMVKEFEEAAFSMRVGDVRMVQTKFGWHLIRVEARRQKEVKARHILATTVVDEEDWKSAFDLTGSLRERVLAGESFYQLAMEFSDQKEGMSESPSFSVLADVQPAEFRDALMGELAPVPGKEGQSLSAVIEMKPHGWLMVYELERKQAAPLVFEDVKLQVIERLEYPKRIEAYVNQLKKKTYIDVRFDGWSPLTGGN